MESSSIACYLVDGQGMELLLRRLHPSAASRKGGPWNLLNERGPNPLGTSAELCLFGLPAGHEAAALTGVAGLEVRVVTEALAAFPPWVKRDARRRRAPVRYCLASDDPDLRRQARELGVEVLDQAGLLRRLGLVSPDGGKPARVARPVRREPSLLKGGKDMSTEELHWWCDQLGVEGGDEDALGQPAAADQAAAMPAPAPEARRQDPASDPSPAPDPELARYARWMGADPADPRILDHRDEQWAERHFPGEAAPPDAPPPPRRKGKKS